MTRRWFSPILAGAEPRDRLRACLGAAVAVAAVGAVGAILHGTSAATPWIVGPIGASAVLVFVVPTSPMAQPWPTIAGNGLSALVGITVAAVIGHGTLAGGIAVALAILVMSATRSLHPPGGAAALTATLGGPGIDWLFPLAPVALNAIVLVAAGWVFHRLVGHEYPRHTPAPAASPVPLVTDEDIDVVLADLHETFDVSPEDLREIVRRLETRLAGRASQRV